jgi:hypothetical protein
MIFTKIYRSAIRKLKKTVSENFDVIIDLREQNERLFNDLQELQKKFDDAMTRLNKYDAEQTTAARKDTFMTYSEIRGDKPVLWINFENTQMLAAGTFANVRDQIKRLCPKIDLIVATAGSVKLYELDAKDLEKLGLARIIGRTHGELIEEKDKI